jgi:hypothetical protein
MTSFLQLIPRLREAGVEFVIIGGVAAIFHGVENATMDLDVVAPMRLENLQRLIIALAEIHPKFRMRPDLPVVTADNPNLKGIKNLYLMTDIGQLDVLGLVEGVGDYDAVVSGAIEADLGEGIGPCRVIDLDGLITAKRTAGRPKDMPVVFQLEAIRKRSQSLPPLSPPAEP